MLPTKGITTHPGEMLSEDFLKPMGINQADFARYIDVDVTTLSAVVKGRREMTQTMIMKVSMALNMSPEFWIELQAIHIYTKNRETLRTKKQLPRIKPLAAALELNPNDRE